MNSWLELKNLFRSSFVLSLFFILTHCQKSKKSPVSKHEKVKHTECLNLNLLSPNASGEFIHNLFHCFSNKNEPNNSLNKIILSLSKDELESFRLALFSKPTKSKMNDLSFFLTLGNESSDAYSLTQNESSQFKYALHHISPNKLFTNRLDQGEKISSLMLVF